MNSQHPEKCPKCGADRHLADHIPNNLREYICGSGIDIHGFYESNACKLQQFNSLREENTRMKAVIEGARDIIDNPKSRYEGWVGISRDQYMRIMNALSCLDGNK